MTRQAVKVENGQIMWRGSTEHWSYLPPESARKLRRELLDEWTPKSHEWARQIASALDQVVHDA